MLAPSRLPAFAIAAVILLGASTHGARAETEAAVGKPKLWQQDVTSDCSGSLSSCSIEVFKVPRKHRLDVTHVNCFVGSSPSGVPFYVRSRNALKAGGSVYDHYLPVATEANFLGQFSVVNAQTRFGLSARDTLWVQTTVPDDVQSLTCHLAGDLTRLK